MDGDRVAAIVRGLEWLLGAQPQRSDQTRVPERDLREMAAVLGVAVSHEDSIDRVTHLCRVGVERDISRVEDTHWSVNGEGESERDLALLLLDPNMNVGHKDRAVAAFRNAGGDPKSRRRLRNDFLRKIANLLADIHPADPQHASSDERNEGAPPPTRRFSRSLLTALAVLLLVGVGFGTLAAVRSGGGDSELDVTILDLTVECRGQQVVTEVARVRNFEPLEGIRYEFTPRPTGPIVATNADRAGERAVFWWCDPGDAGARVEIEVIGIDSGRSVVLPVDMVVAGG